MATATPPPMMTAADTAATAPSFHRDGRPVGAAPGGNAAGGPAGEDGGACGAAHGGAGNDEGGEACAPDDVAAGTSGDSAPKNGAEDGAPKNGAPEDGAPEDGGTGNESASGLGEVGEVIARASPAELYAACQHYADCL
ncbi:hypothetical protein AB0H83_46460 [Dactylosporangium sp. NPDC050688]|uniref:hypothetical protein n=1 Tax=Dactylosporangium sp. NPDC050688 TaxID=3157217 RepID=UPI0033C6A6D3